MTLTPEDKAKRARQRKIQKAKEYSLGTYSRKFVAPVFQRMIRAEAGALPEGFTPAIVKGHLRDVLRCVGQCACVTCGRVLLWFNRSASSGSMDTGHFLASRCASILYEEDNVSPQCVRCNQHEHGAQDRYRLWMVAVRGEETIERLERLKNTPRQFTRDELVDMRIGFEARLKAAEERMET